MTDLGLLNEDWLRSLVWDIWKADYSGKVDRLDDLRTALDLWSMTDSEWRTVLQQFVELPFWIPAPQNLKDEAAALLASQ